MQSGLGKLNKNGYSALFVIDRRYKYKLDIVSGSSVMQFVDEFLSADRIKMINVLSSEDGAAVYGTLGAYGVVVIKMKRRHNVNYKVAGLLGQ